MWLYSQHWVWYMQYLEWRAECRRAYLARVAQEVAEFLVHRSSPVYIRQVLDVTCLTEDGIEADKSECAEMENNV